jgi:hypothetical protein
MVVHVGHHGPVIVGELACLPTDIIVVVMNTACR